MWAKSSQMPREKSGLVVLVALKFGEDELGNPETCNTR